MIKDITYNLPGYGFAKCYLLGQAIDVMDLFEDAGILEKMKNTCQLGTMKYVYPGAHHTRYEYVFTQLMLISNIVSVEDTRFGVDISRTSDLGEYSAKGYKVSGGAVMQCLAILSNAGHMYDTFTSSRILMSLLKESKESNTAFYNVYRRNLPAAIRTKFDFILDNENFYKLHLFSILHIIQGLRRSEKHKVLCDLCILLITQLIDETLIQNEATTRVFSLYKKVRKIAYLSVDMVYTPASFGANLSRMIYSIPSYVDDLFDENSSINRSIQQLEDIIHQQIYDSPMCILNSNRIVQDKHLEYQKEIEKISNIFQIREMLLGLFGELYFMKKFMIDKFSINTAINSWSGPASASKDFAIGTDWYEIKTIGANANTVEISSVTQLSSDYPGYLVVIRTESMANTFSNGESCIGELLKSIVSKISDETVESIFLNKVSSYGFDLSDENINERFDVRSFSLYKVDEHFPRITSEDVRYPEICSVRYALSVPALHSYLEE